MRYDREDGGSLLASVLSGVFPSSFAAAVADCQRSCAAHLRCARCLASRTKLAVAQAPRRGLLKGLIILSHPVSHLSAALPPVCRDGFRWRNGMHPFVGGVEVLGCVAKGRVLRMEGSPGS